MSQLNRTQLTNDINNKVFTNTSQQVTAANVNSVLQNLADSQFNILSDGDLIGLNLFDQTQSYPAGKAVIYATQSFYGVYVANTNVTPGAFDTNEWDLVKQPVSNGLSYYAYPQEKIILGGTLDFDTELDADGQYGLRVKNGFLEVGELNTIQSGSVANLVIGSDNNLSTTNRSIVFGDNSSMDASADYNVSIGSGNTVEGSSQNSLVLGQNNLSTSNQQVIVLGEDASVESNNTSIIINKTTGARIENSGGSIVVNNGGTGPLEALDSILMIKDATAEADVFNSIVKINGTGDLDDLQAYRSFIMATDATIANGSLNILDSIVNLSYLDGDLNGNSFDIRESLMIGDFNASGLVDVDKSIIIGDNIDVINDGATVSVSNSIIAGEANIVLNTNNSIVTGYDNKLYGSTNRVLVAATDNINTSSNLTNTAIIAADGSTIPANPNSFALYTTSLELRQNSTMYGGFISAETATTPTTDKYFGRVELDASPKTVTCPVEANDLVFLTLVDPTHNTNYIWISNQTNGSFDIEAKHTAIDDTIFAYWMIIKKNN